MPKKRDPHDKVVPRLAETLAQMRLHSGLTQKQVAARMATTQAAVARLERGQQNPSVRTLLGFASANGFCLEIGFVRSSKSAGKSGCILVLEDSRGAVKA